MTPSHHPPDDWLAAYAIGSTEDAEELLIATHLALCPRCRLECQRLDAVGGVLLGRQAAPLEMAVTADIGALRTPVPPPPRARQTLRADEVPEPLRTATGPLASVPFRRVAPGVWRHDLPGSRPDRPVALVSLAPGLSIPAHRHDGLERGLVLCGGFTDDHGHFTRGDVSVRGPDDTHPHRQRTDDDGRCVVLMVDDGRKRPVTRFGRFMAMLFDR